MRKKTLLLTGATGFIGRALVPVLQGEKLRLLSRSDPQQSHCSFYQGTIDAVSDYALSLHNVDVVIHLAARVHILSERSADPLGDFRAVNTEGTLNLARQAADAGVKRFIFLSSIKVNGESTSARSPFTALDQRLPESPYGISKSEAEKRLLELGTETGLEIVIIRSPLVYGEGVKANFKSLMNLIGKGFPMPFRAVNRNRRSLVSVYNLADLVRVCVDHPYAANQVFLVSDDDDLSTSEIVALMCKTLGIPNRSIAVPVWCFKVMGKLFKKESTVDRLVGSLQVDISHTRTVLDWTPPFSVEHGFRLTAREEES